MPEWWICKYQEGLSSKRYWRMAGCLGSGLTNSILHEKLGLLNIEEYHRVKHKERMEM